MQIDTRNSILQKNIGLHGVYLLLAILTALVIVALLTWTFLPSIQLIAAPAY